MKKVFFAIAILCSLKIFAQTNLPVPRNILETFEKNTRSITGKPGKNYWQNTADYNINVSFDPSTRVIKGNVEIEYVNNSPDSLKLVYFKLYPNLYKKGALRAQKVEAEDLTDGMQITKLEINGKANDTKGLSESASTNMIVKIDALAPNQKIKFSIDYNYVLNKTSHIRTGEVDDGSYFIAYFFPRIAVYDDIDGWNKIPYNGIPEFYNDFCNFKAKISVPDNYVVWATGNLLNCNTVFNKNICERIAKAEKSDNITTIIDTTDLQTMNVTAHNTVNTWQFEASDVTDFVFATSNHYIWKSSSIIVDKKTGRRTRVDAAFNPNHKDYFDVIDEARATVEHMSYDFPAWPYPYPHETVFDGLDQMEYPMMVNDNPEEDNEDEIELTDHEIFHTMFPFYMGINETKYGWMDEGWATIGEWLISPMIDSEIVDEYGVHEYSENAGDEGDVPIMLRTDYLGGSGAYFLNCYPKPAFGYLYVKDMLGNDLFTKAIHHYIEQWHSKHPMPYDFFYSMNEGSGKNLNWFWKRWFFDDGFPDLAITKVSQNKKNYNVLITCKGIKPVPVDLKIYFEDGSTQKIHRDISVWENANTNTISFSSDKKIQKLTLGDTYDADVNDADNVYEMK